MPEEINGVRSPESASLEDDAQAQNKKISSGIYKDAGEMMCDILGKEEYCSFSSLLNSAWKENEEIRMPIKSQRILLFL